MFLSVSHDATIIGSHESRDYPLDPSAWALIFARAQDNVGIIGNLPAAAAPASPGGTINGNYSAYIDRYDPGKTRAKTARETTDRLNLLISQHRIHRQGLAGESASQPAAAARSGRRRRRAINPPNPLTMP